MKKAIFTLLVSISLLSLNATNNDSLKVDVNLAKSSKSKITKFEDYYQVTSFFENGQTKEIGFYDLNLEKTGEWISYNDEGKKISIANFKNGKKNGEWKIYDPNGHLIIYILYKRNKVMKGFQWTETNGIVSK